MAPARPLPCRLATEWLSVAHEQDLPDERRAALQLHLQRCQACTTLREQWRVLRSTALQGGTLRADGRRH